MTWYGAPQQPLVASGPPPSLTITTSSLPNATVGSLYIQGLIATGGTPPYTWNYVSAKPNSGLWLHPATGMTSTGALTGIPLVDETETLTVQVNDSVGVIAQKTLNLTVVVTGALSIVTNSTLPPATNGGAYFQLMIAQGGAPPYTWTISSQTGTNTWFINNQGWLFGAPTVNVAENITIVVTDNKNATVSQVCFITTNSALAIQGVDSARGWVNLPQGYAGTKYQAQLRVAGGTGAGQVWSVLSGSLPSALTLSSGGLISGTLGAIAGNAGLSVQCVDSGANTTSAVIVIPIVSQSKVFRPAYNTGSGYFVLNGIYYNPNGNEFRMRGVNRDHYDVIDQPGIKNSRSNTVRYTQFTSNTPPTVPNANTYANGMQVDHIANAEHPMLTGWYAPNGNIMTGNANTADLASLATWFATYFPNFSAVRDKMSLNIANEWNGDGTFSTWQSSYISAVSTLRTAGYTCPLTVDTLAFAQSELPQANATAVLASDSLQNVIFSHHSYNATTNLIAHIKAITVSGTAVTITLDSTSATHPFSWPGYTYPSSPVKAVGVVINGVVGMTQINGVLVTGVNLSGSSPNWIVTGTVPSGTYSAYVSGGTAQDYTHVALQSARYGAYRSAGICVVMGEFGPGRGVTPVPSNTSIGESICAFEANGLPWMYWAWDAPVVGDNGYGATRNASNGTYNVPADLTQAGLDVVLNPRFGIAAMAAPAESFL